MKCPNCNETLVMTERQGVEIDYCPACRGVWLDRGELDKIIERSAAYSTGGEPTQHRDEPGHYDQPQYARDNEHYKDPSYKHRKKKGFLSDFFDFD